MTDTTGKGRKFHSAFYLDTAPDLDPSDTGVCAVLLRSVEAALSFDKIDINQETA